PPPPQDYEYPLHPHNTNYQKNDRCPPPPQTLPDRACEVLSCRSDSECERHKRCCFNGCIYACLESVQPPPVLDWLVQPKPRWLGGNGWLLDGPEEVLQAEACSTTEDGDEPLHCPTGYECHIINPGSPSEGIPNRGQCIKQRGNSDGRHLRPKYTKEYHGGNFNNVVVGVDKTAAEEQQSSEEEEQSSEEEEEQSSEEDAVRSSSPRTGAVFAVLIINVIFIERPEEAELRLMGGLSFCWLFRGMGGGGLLALSGGERAAFRPLMSTQIMSREDSSAVQSLGAIICSQLMLSTPFSSSDALQIVIS
ncbi:PREDICTED: WAP four-disulfide core domain protein 1, partial [Nanorana parkeri]|uniref:WAP four-disulfide core domain protein 1 n=1 Tax=Nanorana parkeri TaxID=125878 RepID=UPI00085505A2